jgi:CRISPR-associated endonuclease Cas1
MQQLPGREGARVRRAYRYHSERTGIKWIGRAYNPNDWDSGDLVNRALSAANASLYGVVHPIIVALGCTPALGFVHTGHQQSFVYDSADLYKADLTIPLAFDIAADQTGKLARRSRLSESNRRPSHYEKDLQLVTGPLRAHLRTALAAPHANFLLGAEDFAPRTAPRPAVRDKLGGVTCSREFLQLPDLRTRLIQ